MALGQKVLTTAKALGDATRFSIYRYLHSHNDEPVTIDRLARHFSLHPNAVRLHINKLEQAGLVTSAAARSPAGGGRPHRVYKAGPQPVEIMLPYRNFRLLAQLLAGLVSEIGMSSKLIEGFGLNWGRTLAESVPEGPYDQDQITEIIKGQLKHWGLGPIARNEDFGTPTLVINNCVFKEVAENFPGVICALVHSVLTGMVGDLSPQHECLVENGIARGEPHCLVRIEKK